MSFGQPPDGPGRSDPPDSGGFGSPPGGAFGPPGPLGPPGGSSPFGPPPMGPQTDPLAIVAIVLGMFSLITCACCGALGIPFPIAAAICGGISLSRQRSDPDRFSQTSRPLAIAGLAIGAVILLLSIVTTILGLGNALVQDWDAITFGM